MAERQRGLGWEGLAGVARASATTPPNSFELRDIKHYYIDIVGLIGVGICNQLMGLTIFAAKKI